MKARDQLKLEARRSALHKLSAAAVVIQDAVAAFDRPEIYLVADLDPTAREAAAKIASTARTLAAHIKRTIASLNEES